MGATALQQTADNALHHVRGQDLSGWLQDQVDAGLSFQAIADKLHVDTDGIVVVSREAIRRWVRS